jgi:DNA-binding transcriptional LysR family regulator
MDRLTSLTAFVRVVDSGGFSAAGRKLNMSTTMVSNHVQALEERLGARLLNRTTRKVSVTEVGKVYYDRAIQILADLEQADDIAGALQSTPRGTLRIYTATHVVQFIAPVVVEFLGAYPEVKVDLSMGERTIDLIDEGFDVAIRLTPPPDSSLIVRSLATWRHVLSCSPAYLDKHGPLRQLSELADHNCVRHVLYPYEDEWRFVDRKGTPASVRVSGNLISNSGETLRMAALQGVGISLAPGFLIADDLDQGRLVRLLPEYRPVEFAMNAVYPHRHHLSAKVRSFIDLLAHHSAEHQKLINPYA